MTFGKTVTLVSITNAKLASLHLPILWREWSYYYKTKVPGEKESKVTGRAEAWGFEERRQSLLEYWVVLEVAMTEAQRRSQDDFVVSLSFVLNKLFR